jgi:serine/threonine protein kinase
MGLSAAQMAQMSALLDEALDLDEAGRRQWLERLGPEHRELESALRQALLPQEGDGAGLDRLATLPKVGAAGGRVSTLKPGEWVGPYQLERALGSGGMAEVWLAQRADGAFKRQVALKLPMLSDLRQDLASRFARERDILAGLEHPNIARLYDAGVTPEGLPYLAMEYVHHGDPLTAWCNAHRLGIRDRLKLFLQVLDAVQYAHGHQVIHRDIKPSNILVTPAGVWLLDFGVAKLVAPENERTELTRQDVRLAKSLAQGDEQTELTQLYGRALTPEYASPELIRGDPIGAAADVYSLGIVLYELLSGSRPYRIKAGASLAALEQAVASAPVEPPSTQLRQDAGADRSTTQDKLARRLRGDLDAIVLKALAKRPEDRYGSAAALADDLQRYLTGEPVKSRPAHLSYRFSKFVLRHQIAVPVGATSVLLFAAMGWGLMRREVSIGPAAPSASSIPTQGLATQNPTPAAATDKSIAVLPFVDMSEKHDQEYFSDGLSEELIDRLSRAADLRVISRTSSFSFKGKQATIGDIAKTLGVSHVLEGSVRKAGHQLRITAQLIRAADGTHLWSQTYDRNLSDIFKVQSEIAGTVAQALKATLNSAGEGTQRKQISAEAYNLLLEGNFFSGRLTKVDSNRAIEFYKRALDIDPNYALAWAKMAKEYARQAGWGWIPGSQGAEGIEKALKKARELAQHALRLNPDLSEPHRTLGEIYEQFDWDWSAARAQYQRARELEPDDLRLAEDLAWLNEGMYGRLNQGIEIERQKIERDPLDTGARSWLSWCLFLAGRYEEAVTASRQVVLLNPSFASGYTSMAYALLYLGRLDEALAAAREEADERFRLQALPVAFWALGRKAESDAALNELETKYANSSAYDIAEMYAYRGEIDSAFQWLDRAYRQRDIGMPWVRVDPLLQNLHKDQRYKAVLVKMKLDGDPPTALH